MEATISCTDPPKKSVKSNLKITKEQKEWRKLEHRLLCLQEFSCNNFNIFEDMELHYCASAKARQSETPRELMEKLESLPNFKWNELQDSTVDPFISLQKNLELGLLEMALFSLVVLGKPLVSHAFCLHDNHGFTYEEDLLDLPEPPSHDPWEDVCLPIIIPREKKKKTKASHQNQGSEVSEKISRVKQSNDLVHSDTVKQFRKAIQKVSKADRAMKCAKTTLSKLLGTNHQDDTKNQDDTNQQDKHAMVCCNIDLNICKDLHIWAYGFKEVAKINEIPLTPRIFKLENDRLEKMKKNEVETEVANNKTKQQQLVDIAIKDFLGRPSAKKPTLEQSFFLETEPKQTQGFILRHLLYQMALLELLAPSVGKEADL
jgi:hypothetical protein